MSKKKLRAEFPLLEKMFYNCSINADRELKYSVKKANLKKGRTHFQCFVVVTKAFLLGENGEGFVVTSLPAIRYYSQSIYQEKNRITTETT